MRKSRSCAHLDAATHGEEAPDIGQDLAPRSLVKRQPEEGHADEVERLGGEQREVSDTVAVSVMQIDDYEMMTINSQIALT